MTRRVLMHIGTPKSGTTFLQQVLWSQRDALREHGVLLPGRRFNDHWLACMDVRGKTDRRPAAVGAWERLLQEVDDWDADALISHELFAGATAEQVRRVVGDLEARGLEVHVVVTARDLARQIPAEWQQHLKERHNALSLPDFIAGVRTQDRRSAWFWTVQDVAQLMSTWHEHLPAGRLHLVTVPPPGAAPEVLWGRFAAVMRVEPGMFSVDVPRSNSSIGLEQAELLRRINLELGDRLARPGAFSVLVKDELVNEVLAARPGTKLTLTRPDWEFAVERAEAMVRDLEGLQLDVAGDLTDLVPQGPAPAVESVPTVAPERVLDETVAALVATLDRHDRRLDRLEHVRQDLAAVGVSLPGDRNDDAGPARRALVAASRRWRWAARAKRLYKRSRRRPVDDTHG